MKNIIVLYLLFMLLSVSCKKESSLQTTRPESLMFGMYNPMCEQQTYCGSFYLLKNNMIFSDRFYYLMSPADTLTRLPDSLCQIASQLVNNFPSYLIAHPADSSIGCPGCTNGMVVRLWAITNGVLTKWDVNADTTQLPLALRAYIWQVEQVYFLM